MTGPAASVIIGLLWLACGVLIWRNLKLRRENRRLRVALAAAPAAPATVAPTPGQPAAVQTGARNPHRILMERLGLAEGALPKGGDWRIGDDLLLLILDEIERALPEVVVELGSGLSTAVIAQALECQGKGHLWSVEADPAYAEETLEQVARLGLSHRVTLIEAALEPYDNRTQWYDRKALGDLPQRIDLLLIDGPPHHAGKTPRHPAGPELFSSVAPGGLIVLDDGRRQKEKKTLRLWHEEFPDFEQRISATDKQAAFLRRKEHAR
ncbi:MAG: class I SAM-dependent methyltransferase [Pseudomonadota bacterium]